MGLILLVFLVVALVLIGVGMVVGLVVCALGGILLSVGVAFASVFVGVCSGRPAWAVRAFLLQCGVLAGVPAGAMGAWLAQSVFTTVDQTTWAVVIGGALGGGAGGVGIALLLDYCLNRLRRRVSVSKQAL